MRRKEMGKSEISPLLPAQTRWTSHYLCIMRLLELMSTINALVAEDDDRQDSILVTGDAKSKLKGIRIKEIVHNGVFWNDLLRCVTSHFYHYSADLVYRVKRHLEPFALAANITQTTFCRLDDVLLTFGALYHTVSSWDSADSALARATQETIMKRWMKMDHDVHIAAVILNPRVKNRPFTSIPQLNVQSIYALLGRLWKRFFREDPPSRLIMDVYAYIEDKNDFANLPLTIRMLEVLEEEKLELRKKIRLSGSSAHDSTTAKDLDEEIVDIVSSIRRY